MNSKKIVGIAAALVLPALVAVPTIVNSYKVNSQLGPLKETFNLIRQEGPLQTYQNEVHGSHRSFGGTLEEITKVKERYLRDNEASYLGIWDAEDCLFPTGGIAIAPTLNPFKKADTVTLDNYFNEGSSLDRVNKYKQLVEDSKSPKKATIINEEELKTNQYIENLKEAGFRQIMNGSHPRKNSKGYFVFIYQPKKGETLSDITNLFNSNAQNHYTSVTSHEIVSVRGTPINTQHTLNDYITRKNNIAILTKEK